MSAPWPEGKKLVHLDLKGAPPRIDYLLKLISVFAELGADGLLMEYEDTFPYEGELQLLRAPGHYSREEVLRIQEEAKSKDLEVIPLIQSFGHMEFVLKHQSLSSLREVPHCLGTLSPHGERPLQLLMEMFRQVLELHPDARRLHIGADEVYLLGEGAESRKWLQSHDQGVAQLFLSHVTRVGRALKGAWPQLSLLMWDDMMRDMSPQVLRDSGLVGLVEPMLWDYKPDLDVENTVSLLEKYAGAGLGDVWAAGCFKGCSSVHSCVSSSRRHVDNCLQWLRVSRSASVHFRGIALTGWQRYDHLSVLCELLPVSLPSLASCLQTLLDGKFDSETETKVKTKLGVSSVEVEEMEKISRDSVVFPGRLLAELIVDMNSFLNLDEVRNFQSNMLMRGWFSPFQRQRKLVNPLVLLQIQNQINGILAELQQRSEALKAEMVRFYPESAAQEWLEEHVWPIQIPLQRTEQEVEVCLRETLQTHGEQRHSTD